MHIRITFVLLLLTGTLSFTCAQSKRPNILWITAEDLSPHMGCYGDKLVSTPHIDKLAAQGVRYTNAFTTAGVCAPSRSAIITGMYQQSIGTQHMRTIRFSGSDASSYPPGYISYSAVIPEQVKCFSEYLRMAGYYCSNNAKEDYQFQAPVTAWDESSNKAHWRNRKDKGQPFFSVFNLGTTHESQVWKRAHEPMLVDPSTVTVPPYYPDIPEVRKDIARHLSNTMVLDKQVGEILNQLEADGLTDNTIIFFYSDHGDGLPFAKRELYDRGLRVPLIIQFAKNFPSLNPYSTKGTVDDQMISFVDLAPTMLSLTDCKIPSHMQGQAFLGKARSKQPRKYVFAARDRMDSEYDRVRVARDRRYLYVRNHMPEKPYYQNIQYRLQQPMMPAILKLRDEGKLNDVQLRWFSSTKPVEELYDCDNDPFQLKNIAGNESYKAVLERMRNVYDRWYAETGDLSEAAEMDMVRHWWRGASTPPHTEQPVATSKGPVITIRCNTRGASIAYRFSKHDNWLVYHEPLHLAKNDTLYMMAHRIGYEPSGEKSFFYQGKK